MHLRDISAVSTVRILSFIRDFEKPRRVSTKITQKKNKKLSPNYKIFQKKVPGMRGGNLLGGLMFLRG